jgi:dethiobiotin synthetase
VAARLLAGLGAAGLAVAARKPAQSFADGEDLAGTDAAVLGDATGQPAELVCPPHRWYPVAMAPPMAAEALGRPGFTGARLAAELWWAPGTDIGLVETAGGVRSPQADDADVVDLVRLLRPDLVVLVADAGLGTINDVRLSVEALTARCPPSDQSPPGGFPVVVLNRFDPDVELHGRNADWLVHRCGLEVLRMPTGEDDLVDRVRRVSDHNG